VTVTALSGIWMDSVQTPHGEDTLASMPWQHNPMHVSAQGGGASNTLAVRHLSWNRRRPKLHKIYIEMI